MEVLQEHVQGFRDPIVLSNLLPVDEIIALDGITNRPLFIVNKLTRELRSIKDGPSFTSRERQGEECSLECSLKCFKECLKE